MTNSQSTSILFLLAFQLGCSHFNGTPSPVNNHGFKVPLYFPQTKENGQFNAVSCSVGLKNGYCILDSGMNKSQVAETSDTEHFKTLSKVKSISMFSERTESLVEVPRLVLGDHFVNENISATRSNSFHDLPEYLAVIGADILKNKNFIYDLGVDLNNPAKIIFSPSQNDLAAYNFKYFDRILADKRFIAINLKIDGVNLKAIWDTHAPMTAFSKKFIETHSDFFKSFESRVMKDAHGSQGKQKFYQFLKPLCFASQYCPYTIAEVTEHNFDLTEQDVEGFDAILGNDFILSFHWYFDFEHKKYFVKPR
ncbi:MAG: hypothetical protein JNL11_19475 [Bdellovibrionaceae bacterium]|nr:hypothetical protein [Pseudobdellovibrionaceae bacterium]